MRRRTALAAAAALTVLAACGSTSGGGKASTTTATSNSGSTVSTQPLSGSITVLAASSLTDAFNEEGRQFQAAHPGIAISFSYGASSTLAQQVNAGAPADVLATADEDTMQTAVKGGSVGAPALFAHNRLAILVAKGNPKKIQGLTDLSRSSVVVVMCAVEAPCGKFGQQALAQAGVKVTPASLEANVKGVVSKVTLGEADAGIVYVTDVLAAGNMAEGVTIPDAQNVLAAYPIATVKGTKNAALADAFVAYVRSPAGQQILAKAGFQA